MRKPPKGYYLVTTQDELKKSWPREVVMEGDLMLEDTGTWGPAAPGEIGSPVRAFKGVARIDPTKHLIREKTCRETEEL